jgi:Spy/CpxP family protein refolding chaperone
LLISKRKKENLKGEQKMKKVSMGFATVLMVLALASTTFAYGWGGGGGRGQARGVCYDGGYAGEIPMASQLNLSAEQTEKIRVLREAHLKDIKPLRDKMFAKRGDLKLLWLQSNPDEAKIRAAQKDIRNLRDQMQDKRTSQLLAVLQVLTPEQQAKVKARGPGRGFGPGGGRCAGAPEGGPGSGPRGNW